MVNADRIYGLCPLRPGLSLPVNLARQGRTGSGAPLSLQRRVVCEPDFRRILSMTVGDFTEGVGISQGYTVLDLLAAVQLINRERDGSNASQWLA